MSDQPFDAFGDVIEGSEGGVLGGEALSAFDSSRHQYGPDGVTVEVHCRGCGRPKHVTIAWPEIIAVGYNVAPHEAYAQHLPQFASQWQATDPRKAAQMGVAIKHAWYPTTLRCPRCQQIVAPLVEPGECQRHLQTMRQNRWMHPGQEQQLSNLCHQVAQQLGRR